MLCFKVLDEIIDKTGQIGLMICPIWPVFDRFSAIFLISRLQIYKHFVNDISSNDLIFVLVVDLAVIGMPLKRVKQGIGDYHEQW